MEGPAQTVWRDTGGGEGAGSETQGAPGEVREGAGSGTWVASGEVREGAGSETWMAPGEVKVQGLGLKEPLGR